MFRNIEKRIAAVFARLGKVFSDLVQLPHKTSFRISLLATFSSGIITFIMMLYIYYAAKIQIFEQIDARLQTESIRIANYYEYNNPEINLLSLDGFYRKIETEPEISYCIINPNATTAKIMQNERHKLLNYDFADLCAPELPENTKVIHMGNKRKASKNTSIRILISSFYYDKYILIVGYDTLNEKKVLSKMIENSYNAFVALMINSFIAAFLISYLIFKSTRRISKTATLFADGKFSERIKIKSKDSREVKEFISDLNYMLNKIDMLITSQRQVTNNIAHDLRSPLHRMRSRLEVALQNKNRSNQELRDVLTDTVIDIEKLLNTFNSILSIAQIEARARDDFQELDPAEIMRDLCEMYEYSFEEEGKILDSSIADGLSVFGNKQLIAQAVSNLIDNAIKYTKDNGKISVNLVKNVQNQVVVSVADNGIGIPLEDRERVLQRFVRLDSARSSPGNGLGLSLVKVIADLHKAEIRLDDNNPGLKISLIFPNTQEFQQYLSISQNNN